jgi:hypothetical protein
MHAYGIALVVKLEEKGRLRLLSWNTISFLPQMLEAEELEGGSRGRMEVTHQC